MINDEIKHLAFVHAKAEAPREACGLVILSGDGSLSYFPCKNVSEGMNEFSIDPEDYARAEDLGEVAAIIHSHTQTGAKPSEADLVSCESTKLPWYIVAVPSGAWEMITPNGYKAPLLGRKYSHGVLDCYSFVRDWLRENDVVELPDFDRKWEWWLNGQDLYADNFEKCGFVKVTDMQPGDVILMAIRSKVINHAAIYLGGNVMAHHAIGRLSMREVYGGFWEKNTRLVVRYGGKK